MIIKNFRSIRTPQMNTKILRSVEKLVCHYRENLPDGWRCGIEFQGAQDANPYYLLDVQSNQGGGDFAPVKMQTLKLFPETCATGNISLPWILEVLTKVNGVDSNFLERLSKMWAVGQLTAQDWGILKEFGITHWYGGIRIPYDILETDYVDSDCPIYSGEEPEQEVNRTKGEIRIAFSGAKEWQDTFFCFRIFERIQKILNNLWDKDQIWYNLRDFDSDPNLRFWVKTLDLKEALKD